MSTASVNGQDEMLDWLVTTLAGFNGHRSVWIDGHGTLIHTEPDETLDSGWRCVATLLHPDRKSLAVALHEHLGSDEAAANGPGRATQAPNGSRSAAPG
ncbi:MAG: hypothetical protein B7733_21260 [Myxococcales bacterium FL481]|nr:MAG: hypothetical protein B7733_21260 [Myxococcales bacterium FL481]